MAKDFSFDIVSEFDISKVDNATDRTKRAIDNRYDFKGTKAKLDFDPKIGNGQITITGDNQFQLDSIIDILRKELAGCDVSQKILDTSSEPTTNNMQMTWVLPLKKGLDQDKAKQITKLIREKFPKVKTQIQGESVRATGSSKDDLQSVMQLLTTQDFEFPLNFTNYR